MDLFLPFSDQWSPVNQDGKKQYDRQFLLLLQVAILFISISDENFSHIF
jgi:hypothetical protein